METQLSSALVDWLRSDTVLKDKLIAVEEEAPVRVTDPWLGIASSGSVDRSFKERKTAPVGVALELHLRGDHAATGADMIALVEDRIEAFAPKQAGFLVAIVRFLRARAEKAFRQCSSSPAPIPFPSP